MSLSTAVDALVSPRRTFIGGSEARTIMGPDEGALLRLWRKKRGEEPPQDFSNNLPVQLGRATEALNRAWYQRQTGRKVTHIQQRLRHRFHRWMAATLDGMVEGVGV